MLGQLLEKSKNYDPRIVEEQVSKWWRENRIIEKVFSKNKGAPIFSFLEGPPTVNGFMHIGHTRGRVYKDIVLRYQGMRGFDVWRKAGWDCQGLPTEIEVEKKLNIMTKKDLERIGMERFIEEANKTVDYYISEWRKASERLALWLDYDNAYETRKEEYMEHIWYFLKKCYEKGWLVESLRVVPYCPRCETPLSQHELAQGYEEIKDPSIYVKIPLLDDEGKRFIIIWTTTPWTIPGNEAVAIHPSENYVEIETRDGERWILAEPLLERFSSETGVTSYRRRRTYKGRELVGLRYRHPLEDEVPKHKTHDGEKAHTVIDSEMVSMEEGTGCVHTAPAHGPEDFELGRRYNLPIFCPVSTTGVFTEEGGKYAGLSTKEASSLIIEDLKRKGLLVKAGEIVHNYPLCWRCNTPLIYLASKQWFLTVEPIKEAMVKENEKVRWWPEWAGSNRFGEWLKNAEDWCISRTKIWGTPLNVWVCINCGEKKLIGSRSELNQAVKKPEVMRMHRPWIDQFVFRCGKCGGEMHRVPFVLDTWLDSGVAHFASIDYLSDSKKFELLFPYDFITEAIDQTRGWFYTLLFTSVMLFGKAPFKSVLTQGHVLDEFGKKMSKSRGNVIWAMEAFERFGVDPIRLYLVSKAEPWSTINFVPSEVMQVIDNLNILWNVFNFAKTYFQLDNFSPARHTLESLESYLKPEDRWLLSRVNTLTRLVTRSLDNMEIQDAGREIRRFIVEDLSRTYIRSIRRRVWTEAETKDKLTAYATLYYVLKRIVLLLSIFTPYLAEALYQEIKTPDDPESVHLNNWPKVDERFVDEELEDEMAIVLDTITATLSARQKGGRKLRWPVAKIILTPKTGLARKALEDFKQFIATTTNTKALNILDIGEKPAELIPRIKPDLRKLGRKMGRRLNKLKEVLETGNTREIASRIEKEGVYQLKLDGEDIELTADELIIEYVTPSNMTSSEGKFATVYVDLSETEELKAVSFANELIRRIQVMRKDLQLDIMEQVACVVAIADRSIRELIQPVIDYIEEETRTTLQLASQLEKTDNHLVKRWDINGVEVEIALEKKYTLSIGIS